MRKTIATFLATIMAFAPVMAIAETAVFPIEISPLQPGNEDPQVYMIDRMLTIDGVNPYDYRNSNYAFTGEQIKYNVLVRDNNGKDDVTTVTWKVSGYSQSLCSCVLPISIGGIPYIESQTGLHFNLGTDSVYQCILTVESPWIGSHNIEVQAEDINGGIGSTLLESFEFNPALVVDISTTDGNPMTFSDMNPGRTSFSENGIRLTNIASQVGLWVYFAGTDFYDSDGVASCPSTNELAVSNFEYRAVKGTQDSGWVTMPEYNINAPCDINTCRNGNRIPTASPVDTLAPGQFMDISISVHYPLPCTGNFDTGTFYAIARAV